MGTTGVHTTPHGTMHVAAKIWSIVYSFDAEIQESNMTTSKSKLYYVQFATLSTRIKLSFQDF